MRNSIKVEKARIGPNTFDISYLNSSNILPINNKSVDSKKDFSIILSEDFSRKNFEVNLYREWIYYMTNILRFKKIFNFL